MKTRSSLFLRRTLMGALCATVLTATNLPTHAMAEDVDIYEAEHFRQLFAGGYKDDTVYIRESIDYTSFDPSNDFNGDYTINANLEILNDNSSIWKVIDIPISSTFTFNGNLNGQGNMAHSPSGNPESTYIFKGDMSTFYGSIEDYSSQLKVEFDRAGDSEINTVVIQAKEILFTNAGNYSISNRGVFSTELLRVDKEATASFNNMNLSKASSINNEGVIKTNLTETTLNDGLEGSGSFEFTSKGITLKTSQSSDISNELKFAGGSNTMSSANSSDAISLASLTGAEAGTLLTLSTGSYTLNEATLSQIAVSMGADSTLSVSGKNTLKSGSSLTATGALSFMLDTTAENSLTSTLIVEAGALLDLTAVTGINLMLTGELTEGFSFNLFEWQNDADVQGLEALLTAEDGILINGDSLASYGLQGSYNADANTYSVSYIPEPSTASLSLLALAGLLARRRRKAA